MSTKWAESAEISKAWKTLQSINKACCGAGNKMVKFCTAHQVLLQDFVLEFGDITHSGVAQVLGVSGKERAATGLVKDYANNSQPIGAALWLAINTRTRLYGIS